MIKNLLTLLWVLSAFNIYSFEPDLPIGSQIDFQLNDSWSWAYRKIDSDEIYSTERYTVTEVSTVQLKKYVTFHMETSYNGGPFKLHHKFKVEISQCRRAHIYKNNKFNFLIRLFPYRNGKFEKPIFSKALAFEEKFNCNGNIYQDHFKYRTEFKTVIAQDGKSYETFRQHNILKPKTQINGYYDLTSGILIQKTFNEGSPEAYVSELL